MNPPSTLKTTHWSTQDVAPRERFDYYASALSSALVPMSIEQPSRLGFSSEMSMSDLGTLAVVRQRGTPHRCFAGKHDVVRNEEHSFHLLVNVRSDWNFDHVDRYRMAPGEAILTDSDIPWDIDIGADYEFVHLKLSAAWLGQWLRQPSALVGRRISMDSAWGRALSSFVMPLSHEFLEKSPLPIPLIVDHVGSLLALAARDMRVLPDPPPMQGAEQALLERIKEAMRQLCTSSTLTAADVAVAVGVSLRTFHRSFQRAGEAFGVTLTQMRCVHGMRMLESPLFRRVAIGEIARRAGFCDASHFSRVVRARTGLTPRQIRRGDHSPQPDEDEPAEDRS